VTGRRGRRRRKLSWDRLLNEWMNMRYHCYKVNQQTHTLLYSYNQWFFFLQKKFSGTLSLTQGNHHCIV
jgi:hypothetical protein